MIHEALKNYDEADFSYKQTVDLGNYELETWLNWAKVVKHNKEPDAGIQILTQGLEFYPENAEIEYDLAGMLLAMNNTDAARAHLIKALKLDNTKIWNCW